MKARIVYFMAAATLFACLCTVDEAVGQTKPKRIPTSPRPKGTEGPASGGVRGLAELPTTDILMQEPEQTRGAVCCMQFENKTGFFVDIWFDNKYQGRISPWQSTFALCGTEGFKTFYAQTTGKSLDWSGNYECEGYIGFMPK